MEIMNCMHMVRRLIEKEAYICDKPLLTQKLWSIVDLMPLLQQANIDDDLVRIITSFLNR